MRIGRCAIYNLLIYVIVFLLVIPNLHGQGNNPPETGPPTEDPSDKFVVEVDPAHNTLNFGTFTGGVVEGTITVGVDGSLEGVSGGVEELPFGDPTSAVHFIITTKGSSKTVTLSNTTTWLTGPDLKKLSLTPKFDKTPAVYITNKDISTIVKMGGKLTVPADTPEGVYTGEVNIIFSYN